MVSPKKAPGAAPTARRTAPRPLQLSLQFADPRHRDQLPRHRVARWVRAALESPAQLTVRFVSSEEGRALNQEYRGQDHATNVLTFDYQHRPLVMADLVLCTPVIEEEALAQQVPLVAHYAHLLVHGTLHAQGYDHETAPEALRMETRESQLLQALGFADPYRR
jgi:probable rRNA maturation factor